MKLRRSGMKSILETGQANLPPTTVGWRGAREFRFPELCMGEGENERNKERKDKERSWMEEIREMKGHEIEFNLAKKQ